MSDELVKILCIDDEEMIRQNLSDYLEDSGYKVFQAVDGKDGVEKFPLLLPDIILVDLRMPSMDGFQVIQKVRELDKDIPIIVISGTGVIQDVIDALRIGAWDYITKPIEDMVIVEHSIKTSLERKLLLVENRQHKENLEKMVNTRTKELNDANSLLKEEIINRNNAEEALKRLNEDLEKRVKERTIELEKSLDNLQKTKNQLVQSEKLASLGVLVSGVAHEINTPVGVAVTATSHLTDSTENYLELYRQGELKKTDLEQLFSTVIDTSKMIMKNLKRAAEQINSFKKVAVDQTSGEKRKFNIKDYMKDILDSLNPKLKYYSHQVDVICDENIEILSYPGAYSQIITNLILNSITHAFENIENGQITILFEKDDGQLKFIYKDNGLGISEENITKIYDPFFTTKRGDGGTGLGMNIVYNLVTCTLGGTIECKSEIGKGVEFTMVLPI